VKPHDVHTREILAEIERGKGVTQRSLSKRLGIALGLTNSLIRRLVNKGYVKVVNVRPNRVKYLITPAGIAEKARATRSYLARTVHLYTETRQHIHAGLLAATERANGNGRVRVVFYGAGRDRGDRLRLSAGDRPRTGRRDRRSPHGVLFRRADSSIRGAACDDRQRHPVRYRLIVLSLEEVDDVRARLKSSGCPEDQVCWLE